jgi:AcrR family transcriptional regulator
MQARTPNAERTRATRTALLDAARALFLEKGYADTGTPELVARAGVTRGALYHHFRDKQALFRAVIAREAAAVAQEIDAAATAAASAVDALQRGSKAYFAAIRAPGRARLLLLDGPAVLGTAEMRRIDLETGGQELRRGLAEALGPEVTATELDVRADLISAMFDRAALAVEAGGEAAVYETALAELLRLLVRPAAGGGGAAPETGTSRPGV